jgi:hypothetical protein
MYPMLVTDPAVLDDIRFTDDVDLVSLRASVPGIGLQSVSLQKASRLPARMT